MNEERREDQDANQKIDRVPNPEGYEGDGTVILNRSDYAPLPKVYAALVIIKGPEIGNRYRLRRSHYTIGRARDADISLRADTSISRLHAQIEVSYELDTGTTHYTLKDLGSTNQAHVNGEAVTRHSLIDGDTIELGGTILKFKLLDDLDARFHKEVQKRIRYDRLTSLLTKETFYVALEAELKHSLGAGLPLSILMMDIDFFKKVNDTWGHQVGSAVLTQIGPLIQANLRSLDLCARYGGEEFIAFLLETSEEQAAMIADRVRQAIADYEFVYDDKKVGITISIGISQCPEDGRTIKELVAKADAAMYWCKNTGRNRICTCTQMDAEES